MYERPAVFTNRLQCVECGRVSREDERGWTARLTVDDQVAVFCPGVRRARVPRTKSGPLISQTPMRATAATNATVWSRGLGNPQEALERREARRF
jgi:hypothetical protein